MLNRFKRLMSEVARGDFQRNNFFEWEVGILLDMEECRVERRRRTEILRQYQRAVERQMHTGPGPPMKLSRFLSERAERRFKAGLEPKGAANAAPSG